MKGVVLMKSKIKQSFDQLSYAYEQEVDKVSLYNSQYERPAMLKQVPEDLTGKSVLDAGCAAGWYTEQLVKRGGRLTAVDLSPKMVAATKRRMVETVQAYCVDLEEVLPFTDNSYDIIVSSLTLHYLKDWHKTFVEFKRILKPSGLLLFSVHHPQMKFLLDHMTNYFKVELMKDRWKKAGVSVDVYSYSRPMQSILNDTLSYFSLEQVIEPQPTRKFKEQNPTGYETLMKQPHFLIVKARNDKR